MLQSRLGTPRKLSAKYGDHDESTMNSTPSRYPTVSRVQMSASYPPHPKTGPIPSLCLQKTPDTQSKHGPSPSSPATCSSRRRSRSTAPSKSLHIKILLSRLLPPELVFPILCLASIYHRTAFIRTRAPLSYRERQVKTPLKIFQCVPPTLHLISSPYSVSGIGDHPLRSVGFYLRFCPANLPNATVSFHARLMRDKKIVEGSDMLLLEPAMDGNVQSRSIVLSGESDLIKMASVGDRIGLWVMADGGLYGDWLHIPGHKMRILVEVREVSIECFCIW
jgi:hypothetical protein